MDSLSYLLHSMDQIVVSKLVAEVVVEEEEEVYKHRKQGMAGTRHQEYKMSHTRCLNQRRCMNKFRMCNLDTPRPDYKLCSSKQV